MITKEYLLKDLLVIKNGKDYKSLNNGTIPVYGTGGVMTYVDSYLNDDESILLPRKGTLDNIIYVNGKFWTVDTIYWTIIDKSKAYPKYLFCYLSLLDLSCKDSGSTLPSMTFDSYYSIPIKLPSLEIQKKYGDFIFKIIEKIKNNNKINTELESMAKTLYDYWFLQFEFPNAEGKPYKSSGGKMVYNEELKREIPEGWKVENIKNICDITWGQCPDGKNILPLDTKETSMLYCSGAGDMRNGLLVDCQARTNASKRYAHKGDVLMSIAGSIGAFAIVNETISLGRAAMAFTPKKCSKLFAYITIKTMVDRMKQIATGSIQKVINDNHINDMNIPINGEILEKFARYNYIIEKQIQLSKENQELASLRDFLLPLLMNGQVTFKEDNQNIDTQALQFDKILSYSERFNQWKLQQGYAARGDVDDETLKKIFDAMDDDDKK